MAGCGEVCAEYAAKFSRFSVDNPIFNWVGDHTPGFTPSRSEGWKNAAIGAASGIVSRVFGLFGAKAPVESEVRMVGATHSDLIDPISPTIVRRAKANAIVGALGMALVSFSQRWTGRTFSRLAFFGIGLVSFGPGIGVWVSSEMRKREVS